MQFSMVSSNGMLVMRLCMSKLTMITVSVKIKTSSTNENESWTVNSFTVNGGR